MRSMTSTGASAASANGRRPADLLSAAALTVTVLLWASAFVAIRAIGEDYSPGSMAFGRVALAALVLTPFALRRLAGSGGIVAGLPRGKTLALVVAYGAAWFGAYFAVLPWAEQHVDAGTAALLVNFAPIIVAVVAGFAFGEGFPRTLVVGMLVAFGGVVLIAVGGTGVHASVLGIALALLSAVLYAAGVLLQKLSFRGVDAATGVWLGCVVGTIVLTPWAPAFVTETAAAPAGSILGLVYLGVFPTAVAFSTWSYALARVPAGRATASTLAAPAVAIALSWTLLGELPTTLALLGGALCLLGVAVAQRR